MLQARPSTNRSPVSYTTEDGSLVTFTAHAHQRCLERGIPPDVLAQRLLGVKNPPDRSDRRRRFRGRDGLVCIAVRTLHGYRVISTWREV